MLVRFSSTATEPLLMFGDSATQLIKMLGATGNVPGALNADDLPAAIARLKQHLQALPATQPRQSHDDKGEEHKRQPAVELTTRAAPLIALLERASASHKPVMWEAG